AGAGRAGAGRAGAGRAAGGRGGPPPATFRRGDPMRRLRVGLLCVAFVLSLFAGRLFQLQGMDYGKYRSIAQRQRLENIQIPAFRGSIEGADGRPLAMTVQADLVFADPTEMTAPRQAAESVRARYAAELAGPLGMPASGVLSLLDHPTSPRYVKLEDGVSVSNANKINGLGIPGIAMQPEFHRTYPDGQLAAGLLGFTNGSSGTLRGAAGLEYEYNWMLAGRSGSQEVEMGGGQPIPTAEDRVVPAVPGRSLRLTVLPDLQYQAEQACAARVQAVRADSCTAVVMNPRTGQLLAVASEPSFNPNNPVSGANIGGDPAVADVFEPGSTAKVITAAAAMEHGGQTVNSPYTVPYQIVQDGFQFHDADPHPTEHLTLAGILVHSSNVGMVQVAQHVSPQVQYEYFRAFGIGSGSGLNLPGEDPGILAAPANWWGNERYTLAFGQGVAINAVQLASVYATIANGGVRVQPSVVAGTVSGPDSAGSSSAAESASTATGGTFTPAAPAPRRRVLQPQTSAAFLRMLQWVPKLDVGPWGVIPGYQIAAKTGTAQRSDPSCGCLRGYNSSYVGMAPASNPQVVVAAVVQNPRSANYYGNSVAGPVFHDIMQSALETLKIPPSGDKTPAVRLTAP
ncbi:MAG: penicillin-binding protein 2, partial [Actinobacteria bacterium]|nr:penicillin-binding protein 2 [Actinomycetota bacterium]